ncbi:MAG: phytoene/squalene synthase family protein [Usitatibacter sp.]
MPVDHYENFPVASWLLPARLRPPIEAIYGFARGADDIADEGDLSDAARLAGLARYTRALDDIEAGKTPESQFARIAWAISEYNLPVQLLRDLISAFSQDVVTKRYNTIGEVLDYSRRSANPVGRLLLHLFEYNPKTPKTGTDPLFPPGGKRGSVPVFGVKRFKFTDETSLRWSDSVCSGLQIVNFWQDVALDWQKGRIYIPQEDLLKFGVTEQQIAEGRCDAAWQELMAFECRRARAMLEYGIPLGRSLPGRVGIEIRATIRGGLTILDKISAAKGDVFRHRPVLTRFDWARILMRSL